MLTGRDDIFAAIGDACDTGTAHPAYTTLLLGRRGSGKTVVLGALRDTARARGWMTIADAAASRGLLSRLSHRTLILLKGIADELPAEMTRSLRAADIRLESEHPPDTDHALRLETMLRVLVAHLDAVGSGLLLTIDELHAGETDDLRVLGLMVQDITRIARLPMLFVGAGLPTLEDSLLSDTAVTFLQRCDRHEIGFLDHAAAWAALSEPIRERGGRLVPEAADYAVTASQGYPFMVQLLGFHAWEAAADPTSTVTLAEIKAGAEVAVHKIGQLVIAPMWRDLSEGSHRFLAAMALKDGPSRAADLAAVLGVSTGYVSVYQSRLREAGMVSSAGRGRLDFALSATRQWIRGLDEFPLLCETLNPAEPRPLGFARPASGSGETG